MQILKVISLLLDYPTEQLVAGRDELDQAIATSREISPAQRSALIELLNLICDNDLMDGQEHYGALFGRGRSLSLLMFEHVHGESRDRGQAMVDLMAQYDFSKQLNVSLNLNNLFDKKYYSAIGSRGWYGTPRSATATLRYAF